MLSCRLSERLLLPGVICLQNAHVLEWYGAIQTMLLSQAEYMAKGLSVIAWGGLPTGL